MHVDVDQPGSHVQPGDVHHLFGFRRIDLLGDARDAAAFDSHVPDAIDAVLGIDHVPALQQQIITRLRRGSRNEKDENREPSHNEISI